MKKLLSLLLVLVMMFSLLPMSALAADEEITEETIEEVTEEVTEETALPLDGDSLDESASNVITVGIACAIEAGNTYSLTIETAGWYSFTSGCAGELTEMIVYTEDRKPALDFNVNLAGNRLTDQVELAAGVYEVEVYRCAGDATLLVEPFVADEDLEFSAVTNSAVSVSVYSAVLSGDFTAPESKTNGTYLIGFEYRVQGGVDSYAAWANTNTQQIKGAERRGKLTDLMAGTTYEYRAFIDPSYQQQMQENRFYTLGSEAAYGEWKTFTTAACVTTYEAVTDYVIIDPDDNVIVHGIFTMPNWDGGGPGHVYGIEWGVEPYVSTGNALYTRTEECEESLLQVDLSGCLLVPWVTYYYWAVIRGGENDVYGEAKTFTAPERAFETISADQSITLDAWEVAQYSFTPQADGTYKLTLPGEGYIAVYDSTGALCGSTGAPGETEVGVTVSAKAGQTYYFGVQIYSDASQTLMLTKAESGGSVTVIASGTCGEDLTWELTSDGVLTISGTGEMFDYRGMGDEGGVSSDAPWCENYAAIISDVVIESGVTSIGAHAFYVCQAIENITIPSSVTSIGEYAFAGCTSLTEIHVDEANIAYCSEQGVLFSKEKTALLWYPTGKTDRSYTIPDAVTNIEARAFTDCALLESVTIPSSVTCIGDDVFYGCTALAAIHVDEANTAYCSEQGVLFDKGKTSLLCYPVGKTDKSYSIPDSVTSIGYSVFKGCTSLESITIPDSVTSIGDSAFEGGTSLASITIGNGVTSIGNSAFWNCTSLESITIPDSMTSIGNFVFIGCTSLTRVTIPDSVTSIGVQAFSGCSALESVTIGSGLTSIGFGMFSSCTALESVTLPDGITSIEAWVFYGCTALTDVYYDGTEEQWAAINIAESYNQSLSGATVHCRTAVEKVVAGLNSISEDATAKEIHEAVQEIGKDALTDALTGEQADEVLEKLEALEEVAGSGTASVVVDASAASMISADSVSIVGAALNTLAEEAESVTLTIRAASEDTVTGITIPDEVADDEDKTVHLELELEGVANPHELAVPVCITIEVPENIQWELVRLVHHGENGTEVLVPTVYVENNVRYARFVIGGFSPFTLTELKHELGNVNGTGQTDILDVLALLKYVAGISDNIVYGDMDNNGAINILDVLQLLKYVAGIAGTKIW